MLNCELSINQLAASNIHYRYYPLSDFMDIQKRLGFKNIELWGGTPHVWIDPYSATDGTLILNEAKKRGLEIPIFMPEFTSYRYSMGMSYELERNKSLEYIKRCFNFASEIESKYILIEPIGFLLDEKAEVQNDNWNRMMETLNELINYSKEFGVDIALITNAVDKTSPLSSIKDMIKCLDELNSAHVFPALDITSMYVSEETIQEWFDTFKDNLVHIHLSNNINCQRHAWVDNEKSLYKILDEIKENNYNNTFGLLYNTNTYRINPWIVDEKMMEILKSY